MTTTASPPTGSTLVLPQFRLQCGLTLPEARLVYQTYGSLSADKSNAILYPTSYGAQHPDIEWLVGPGKILDSSRYFVIIPNMFGNGFSSSPSNLPEPYAGGRHVVFTHVDNVAAQYELVTREFGIDRLALAYGWSMGGQQALHWGALHPQRVARIAAICTSAKTTRHNQVFLEGLRATLTADAAWVGERFVARPERGLRAFARVYAGWALSQAYYREQTYLSVGYSSLEDFLVRDWEASFLRRDPANLLAMIETWMQSDISDNDTYQGDLTGALGSIRARTLIMPGSCDLYFTAEDSRREAELIPRCRFQPLNSIWGHRAGNPVKSPADANVIREAVDELLRANSA